MSKKFLKLSSILKTLLFQRDMKPVDLARELDIPQPTIHRLVAGKSTRPYKSSLQPIADYFCVSMEQLLGEELLPNIENTQINSKIKKINILPWDEIDYHKETGKSDKKQHIIIAADESNCFAMIMHDHSMEPVFPKGTILIFNPNQSPIDRSYVLVKLNGTKYPIFRQLLIDAENRFLKSINPDLISHQLRLLERDDYIIATLFESRISHKIENMGELLEKIT
jgi:hypothetical protein